MTVQTRPAPTRQAATSLRQDLLPEREWTLSAAQVALIVLAIVAACEVIGLLS